MSVQIYIYIYNNYTTNIQYTYNTYNIQYICIYIYIYTHINNTLYTMNEYN